MLYCIHLVLDVGNCWLNMFQLCFMMGPSVIGWLAVVCIDAETGIYVLCLDGYSLLGIFLHGRVDIARSKYRGIATIIFGIRWENEIRQSLTYPDACVFFHFVDFRISESLQLHCQIIRKQKRPYEYDAYEYPSENLQSITSSNSGEQTSEK